MKKPEPVAKTIFPWLRANLGENCLAPLTGSDARALSAAVQIVEVYAYNRNAELAEAFGTVVGSAMQEKCWLFAYHAIAHVMDWSDREQFWKLTSLPKPENMPRCKFEPRQIESRVIDSSKMFEEVQR